MTAKELEERSGHKLIYLAYGGSHAIGTNTPTSDIDLRGVCHSNEDELLGLKTFEQYEPAEEDTIVYSVGKIVRLMLQCNPNILEIFGTLPEHILYTTAEGRYLHDNVDLFLSKRCINSFLGYGTSQLIRLENALVRETDDEGMARHLAMRLDALMYHFQDRYGDFGEGSIKVHPKADKIYLDFNLKDYPFDSLTSIFSEMLDISRTYGKINHRANKKEESALYKHAMHLMRLDFMLEDILDGNGVITYRTKEHDLLMNIRKGNLTFEEVIELHKKEQEVLKGKIEATKLPQNPDMEKVGQLLIYLNNCALHRDLKE